MTEHAAAKIPRRRIDGAWYGFLTVGFLVIGLAGIFGTYASQVPYQRGELAAAELAGLKSELGDNAAIMARQNVPLAENITAARAATRARAGAEAAGVAHGLRLDIGLITVGCALFGCFLLGASGNQARKK